MFLCFLTFFCFFSISTSPTYRISPAVLAYCRGKRLAKKLIVLSLVYVAYARRHAQPVLLCIFLLVRAAKLETVRNAYCKYFAKSATHQAARSFLDGMANCRACSIHHRSLVYSFIEHDRNACSRGDPRLAYTFAWFERIQCVYGK